MIKRSIAGSNIVLPDGTTFTWLWQPAQLLEDETSLHKNTHQVTAGGKVSAHSPGFAARTAGASLHRSS
jgi:hypothetical protein